MVVLGLGVRVHKFIKTNCLWLITASILLQVNHGVTQSQDALVTFYSHRIYVPNGIPDDKSDIYHGSIFDGSQRLFWFTDSIIPQSERYITLRFTPGPHTFGASNGRRPESRETLSLDLKSGERYFVRAKDETKGVLGAVEISHGKLELIPCSEAQAELRDATPLKDKALTKDIQPKRTALVVDEANPPACH